MTWWNRPDFKKYDALICDGAVRSGKTLSMVNGFFLWSMACFHGATFALCGKSISSLRRNVVSQLQDWLGGVVSILDKRSQNKLIVSAGNGHINTYYLFGGQDEDSYKDIQGITLAGALLDEAALMRRSFVEQACARCSVSGSRLWFNCNPEGPEHWFFKEWIQKAAHKNALRLHFTMEDNPALDPVVRLRYERLYTGVFYRRYILGQWCMAQGLIYPFEREMLTAKNLPSTGTYYISVDYGTQNPFSAGLWCVAGDRAVRLREYYYSGRERGVMLTDEEYYEKLQALADGLPIRQVVIDPSAASMIAVIRRHGAFSVRKAKNEVLPGIRFVSSLLQAGAVQIAPACRDTLREFSLYCWENAAAQDRPKKENDHAMDDIRYFCATILRRNQNILKRLGGNDSEEMADRAFFAHVGQADRAGG